MFGVDGGGGYLGLFFVLLSDLIILYMRFLCGGGDWNCSYASLSIHLNQGFSKVWWLSANLESRHMIEGSAGGDACIKHFDGLQCVCLEDDGLSWWLSHFLILCWFYKDKRIEMLRSRFWSEHWPHFEISVFEYWPGFWACSNCPRASPPWLLRGKTA